MRPARRFVMPATVLARSDNGVVLDGVRALAFDVFGTLVDWHGSIVREGRERWAPAGYAADWAALATAWRQRYQPSLDLVRSGARPWVALDVLHRESLDAVIEQFGLSAMPESDRAELNLVWHRLAPWPDVRPALKVLENRYRLTTLSNGNRALLADLARNGRLPFHQVLGAEDFRAYKPQPAVYRGAADRLGLVPSEVAMVAAHPSDLRAAAGCGLRTVFVPRPLEWGPDGAAEAAGDGDFDLVAADLGELARHA